MLSAGMTAFNHRTNSFWEILDIGSEENGSGFKVKATCQSMAPDDARRHLHLNCDETFEILEGRAKYRIGKKESIAVAGEVLHFPAGIPHEHPSAAGASKMVYTHSGVFTDDNPNNFQHIWGASFTSFGLAKAPSQLNWDGLPYSLLQTAALARTFGQHGTYDSMLPVFAGRIVNATLGVFANMMGYHGIIPEQIARARTL